MKNKKMKNTLVTVCSILVVAFFIGTSMTSAVGQRAEAIGKFEATVEAELSRVEATATQEAAEKQEEAKVTETTAPATEAIKADEEEYCAECAIQKDLQNVRVLEISDVVTLEVENEAQSNLIQISRDDLLEVGEILTTALPEFETAYNDMSEQDKAQLKEDTLNLVENEIAEMEDQVNAEEYQSFIDRLRAFEMPDNTIHQERMGIAYELIADGKIRNTDLNDDGLRAMAQAFAASETSTVIQVSSSSSNNNNNNQPFGQIEEDLDIAFAVSESSSITQTACEGVQEADTIAGALAWGGVCVLSGMVGSISAVYNYGDGGNVLAAVGLAAFYCFEASAALGFITTATARGGIFAGAGAALLVAGYYIGTRCLASELING